MSSFEIFIGIDLAWGDKNLSGLCAAKRDGDRLEIIDLKLIKSIDEMLIEIKRYFKSKIYLGIDAALLIPNKEGNRQIEKEFNKDFSKYKISMLPLNRKILTKHSPLIRSELLYKELDKLGFKRDMNSDKAVFEVYPHSAIAVCFNGYKILKYKRKAGRSVAFIKEQLKIYKAYLLSVFSHHELFDVDIDTLKGAALKDFEDKLDSIMCAYTMFYCKYNRCKYYKLDSQETFVTPI